MGEVTAVTGLELEVLSQLHEFQDLSKERLELVGEIITALSNAVEAKDRYTNGHSQRVAQYSRRIAKRLNWNEDQCQRIYYTGLLHDVGKIRVQDTIINKPGGLTSVEFEDMKLHTLAGYYILKGIPSISEFAIGARWHHERYDGSGYPNGLSGENIPLVSRVISVADAYDAMTSNRSYRNIMAQDEVRKRIEVSLGSQFDPRLGKIMLNLIDEDKEYSMRQPVAATEFTLLAIDDDRMSLRLLEFLLKEDTKYKLVTALSGEEGLKLAFDPKQKIDLVLLDVEMPGLNGFDVLECIRRSGRYLPVIFMTGDRDVSIIQRAEAMGVNDYLTKPLIKHILQESIQNVLLSNFSGDFSGSIYSRDSVGSYF